MKDIRFNVSLYIIIPIIFAGIALLSIILSFHLTEFYLKRGMNPSSPVIFLCIIMTSATFLCGLVIAKRLLGPVERFVLQTERLGVLKHVDKDGEGKTAKKDEIGRFSFVFDQVAEILSQVESQELFPQIIGRSRTMRGVLNQIMKVAPTNSTVLILGETGTGKELISRSIHEHSFRKGKPFVAINCAAIPSGLLESELFGHEKGAFTGADHRKSGKFEIASGGTVFMDEIGDMPLETQAKVLRVIEESHIERVGGIQPIPVDLRFIAATNKDLLHMVEVGKFRQDLFYRLHVFSIYVPPLRERKEDILDLATEFFRKLGKNLAISPETHQVLQAYDWPGNVRELQNVLESASVLADTVIEPKHLPPYLARVQANSPVKIEFSEEDNLDSHISFYEKKMILEALAKTGGIQRKAAGLLGISERSLWHRIQKHAIDVSSFKK